ncbi:glycosyltransferase family 4 protein [Cupriavidus necator]
MSDKIRILVELRPAIDGYSGIPQETRLLFRTLLGLKDVAVTGLLQQGGRDITAGLVHSAGDARDRSAEIGAMSRVVVAFSDDGHRGTAGTILRLVRNEVRRFRLRLSVLFGTAEKLGMFSPKSFEDFIWRTFFAKTLPIEDRSRILGAEYRVLAVAMGTLHRVKLSMFGFFGVKRFKRIETRDFDVFIAQTPFPGIVSPNTRMIVRYHDAIPIFMPHTIKDRAFHQRAHYDALARNVRAGTFFACVSAATRDDLLKVFPEIGDRAVVIHNTVSSIYRNEESPRHVVRAIISSRLFRPLGKKYKELGTGHIEVFRRNRFDSMQQDFDYILMVSTVEPRKNHASLLFAWEMLRTRHNLPLKLVFVGDLGWEYSDLVDSMMPWIEKGELFQLTNVSAQELRDLYKHASVTICPSYAEGFDYSGVESMMSGGMVAASDIPVHREVYQEACIYFDPYSVESMASGIVEAMELRNDADAFAAYRERANRISAQYRVEAVTDKWDRLIRMAGQGCRERLADDGHPTA